MSLPEGFVKHPMIGVYECTPSSTPRSQRSTLKQKMSAVACDDAGMADKYEVYEEGSTATTPRDNCQLVYRIKRIEPTTSMRNLAAGHGLCMCQTLGKCPLIAELHEPPCEMCTDPFITRYYPSDSYWSNLHAAVEEMRQAARLEHDRESLQV